MSHRDYHDTMRLAMRDKPAVITNGVYADLATAIVAIEHRRLDADAFTELTAHCNAAQRYCVMLELPAWAQRAVNAFGDTP